MDSQREPDTSLMAQVADGDRQAHSRLLRRHANGLLTFIHGMVGDRHRAEELFQEVFLTVWTHRRRYQLGRAFRPWLYGIAVKKCHADFRRRRPVTADFECDPPVPITAGDPSPAEAAIAAETAVLVANAVMQLSDRQRTVVVMRIWSGLSYREIAQAVGRTEATVRSHMFHALDAMRKYLEPRLQ